MIDDVIFSEGVYSARNDGFELKGRPRKAHDFWPVFQNSRAW